MESLKYDFVVLGSGIAGLTFALEAAAHAKVLVLCKAAITETNTSYAQGGIAAVLSASDSFEQHVQDTLTAGAGLCDEPAVRFMVERAPESIEWLQKQKVLFDRAPDRTIALGLEGGHSQHRIAHVKDHTGLSMQRALSKSALQHPGITVLEYHMGVDLLTQTIAGTTVCYGVQVLDLKNTNFKTITANAIVLATGGSGQVYQYTTNPSIATGDGLAMAHRAGAAIRNMEFFQFHPTALYNPASIDTFLISEALRGAGAVLVLPDGTEFMHRYHSMGSLAPRDIVARAVFEQMQLHHSACLFLDATRLSEGSHEKQFPVIYTKCKSIGIDAAIDFIPIIPAAHYQCGGVQTNLHGQTSIVGLYAIGEVACTGVHGANRLASNSLLEGVVFAKVAAAFLLHHKCTFQNFSEVSTIVKISPESKGNFCKELANIKVSLQEMMWKHLGIVRIEEGMMKALNQLQLLEEELNTLKNKSIICAADFHETQNLLSVAQLIVTATLKQNQSIGTHCLYQEHI